MIKMEEENENEERKLRKKIAGTLKAMQEEQQKKDVMKQLLDAKAYERLMNIRISNNELYNQMVNIIVSLAQTNRITGKMTEQQLISILDKVTVRKDTTIEFKHK